MAKSIHVYNCECYAHYMSDDNAKPNVSQTMSRFGCLFFSAANPSITGFYGLLALANICTMSSQRA